MNTSSAEVSKTKPITRQEIRAMQMAEVNGQMQPLSRTKQKELRRKQKHTVRSDYYLRPTVLPEPVKE